MSSGTSGRKIVILTAPSGAGKTTIAGRVLQELPALRFSTSATTRAPRPHEQDGVDYHFMSEERFRELIREGALLEYEEVYPGRFYGTLHSEVDRSSAAQPVLLDIDVKGARSVKEIYGEEALAIFIRPPSLQALGERLRGRATETEATLRERLGRAAMEMEQAERFDAVVVNDHLEEAVAETLRIIRSFLDS